MLFASVKLPNNLHVCGFSESVVHLPKRIFSFNLRTSHIDLASCFFSHRLYFPSLSVCGMTLLHTYFNNLTVEKTS